MVDDGKVTIVTRDCQVMSLPRLSDTYKSLCKISRRYSSRNLRYDLKRAMSKHASIESIVVGHHWISSCKIHIYWKGKGLSFYYCSNCQYCSKIKCTTALKRDAIFGLSHGSVRNWPSQKSINPFLRACVHCVRPWGRETIVLTIESSNLGPGGHF